MKLPETAGVAGTVDHTRIVYIEDYVLQYLEMGRKKKLLTDVCIPLYGYKDGDGKREIYIINRAGEISEQKSGNTIPEEQIGCLNTVMWKGETELYKAIFIGNEKDLRSIDGYYIYYDKDAAMKDCLAGHYMMDRKESRYQEKSPVLSPYIWIRMAAISILIIFCIVAVTTINSYDKLDKFVQAAVQTGEIIKTDR